MDTWRVQVCCEHHMNLTFFAWSGSLKKAWVTEGKPRHSCNSLMQPCQILPSFPASTPTRKNIYKPWTLQWFCIEQCLNSRKHFWAGWKWNSYDSFGIWIFLTLAHWVATDLWQSHSCGKPNATKLPCGDGLNPTPVMIWGWFIIEFPTLQNITAHTKMSKSCWNSKNVLWHLESYVCLTIV